MTDVPTTETAAIRKTATVPQDPSAAFRLFTQEIGAWWPLGTISVTGKAAGAVCGKGVGEQIVETTDSGDTAPWGTITVWDPPTRVSFSQYPGSPESDATFVEVTFHPADEGTLVVIEHSGWDRRPGGAEMRADYDTGWDLVFGRYVEHAARLS